MRRLLVVVLLVVLAVSGCQAPRHNEGDEPSATPSASPSSSAPALAVLPESIPTGHGTVRPDDVVWAQGSTLHVGQRTIDVAPLQIDALVVVRGGVYFLSQRELWVTDLRMVTPTRVTAVTSLTGGAGGHSLRVVAQDRAGAPVTGAWDTSTGRAVPAAQVRPSGAVRTQVGPGRRYRVTGSATAPLAAYAVRTRAQVRLTGSSGDGFRLVRWDGPATVEGVTLSTGRPLTVVRCDLARGSCTSYGQVRAGSPPIFPTSG